MTFCSVVGVTDGVSRRRLHARQAQLQIRQGQDTAHPLGSLVFIPTKLDVVTLGQVSIGQGANFRHRFCVLTQHTLPFRRSPTISCGFPPTFGNDKSEIIGTILING